MGQAQAKKGLHSGETWEPLAKGASFETNHFVKTTHVQRTPSPALPSFCPHLLWMDEIQRNVVVSTYGFRTVQKPWNDMIPLYIPTNNSFNHGFWTVLRTERAKNPQHDSCQNILCSPCWLSRKSIHWTFLFAAGLSSMENSLHAIPRRRPGAPADREEGERPVAGVRVAGVRAVKGARCWRRAEGSEAASRRRDVSGR